MLVLVLLIKTRTKLLIEIPPKGD